MKKILISIFILVAVGFVYKDLIIKGLPDTHDNWAHTARIVNYYLNISQKSFPPRIGSTFNNWFGYPVFNFNYPMPSILGSVLIKLHTTPEFSVQLLTYTSLLLSALFMYIFSQSVIASLLYVYNGYVLTMVFTRGSLGELFSLWLFPLWSLLLTKLFTKKSSRLTPVLLALTTTAFLLSHNLIAVFASPLMLGYFIFLWVKHKKNLVKNLLPLIIGTLLSLFFWFPALFEKQYTIIDSNLLINNYSQHFPTISQLIHSVYSFGYSYQGPVDGMSYSLGAIQIISYLLALLIIIKNKLRTSKIILILFLLTNLSVFFTTELSKPFYEAIPYLKYLQFPWRLLFFYQLFSCLLIVKVLKIIKPHPLLKIFLISIIIANAYHFAHPKSILRHDSDYWYQFSDTTSTLHENMPIWFDKNTNYQLVETIFKDANIYAEATSAAVYPSTWIASHHSYQIDTKEPTKIIERTAYFPGWRVTANNQPLQIEYDNKNYPGLITYQLNPGNYQIDSQFTENTPARIVGDALSIIGLISLLILFFI